MEIYNYKENVMNDVIEYICEHDITVTEDTRDEVYQQLFDECFVSDSVTGNGSGSYTFNSLTAEQYLIGNKDLLCDALDEFCGDYREAIQSAEYSDVTIRCYILGEAIDAALDKILA